MKLAVDTNVLLRAALDDHPSQSPAARELLAAADLVVVSVPSLCEFVWVLSRRYQASAGDIENSIRRLVGAGNVEVDRPAVEAGLALLAGGGDFADGVVAHEGERLGAETFVSFDRKAVALLAARGRKARLLA